MSVISCRASLLLLAALLLGNSDVSGRNLVSVASKKNAIVIDGKLDHDEWHGAAALYGFVDDINADGTFSSRQSMVFLTYDDDAIYLCVQVPLEAGRTLKSAATERDGAVWTDDDVEITLQPGKDDFYRFLGNSTGVYLDGKNASNDWDGQWNYKSTVTIDAWTAELSMAFSELGVDGTPADGDVWGFNVNHSWQDPMRWTSWNRAEGSFNAPDGFGEIRFGANAPAVRLLSIGTPAKGRIAFEAELVGAAAGSGKADAVVQINDKVVYSQRLDITPDSRQTIRVEQDLLEMIEPGRSNLAFLVTTAEQQPVYTTTIPFAFYPPVDLGWAYFSDRQALQLDVGLKGLRGGVRNLTARFAAQKTGDAEPALTKEYTLPDGESEARLTAGLETLVDGEYRMSLEIIRDGKVIGADGFDFLKRTVDPWDGNRIGISEQVPQPWVPMSTAQRNIVSCWGRDYAFRDSVLPEQIISLKEELLAAPIRIVGMAHDQPIEWSRQRMTIESASDVEVRLTGSARSKYLELRVRVAIEYDGMMRVDLDVARTEDLTPLSALALEIPMPGERAVFIQNAQISAFEHTGRRLDEKQGQLFGHSFLHNIWLGDHRRGLQWFAESDKEWHNGEGEPAMEVVRDGTTVKLLIHFINDPDYLLDWPIHYTFGLHATPAKPVDPVKRRRFVLNNTGDPWFADYDAFAYLWPNLRLKPGDSGMKWFGFPEPLHPDQYREFLQGYCRDRGWRPLLYVYQTTLGEQSPVLRYHYQWLLQPRWRYHVSERGLRGYDKTELDKGYMSPMTKICVNLPSVRDYLVQAYAQFIREYDIAGFYADHVQPFGCQSKAHAGGSCVYEVDGELHAPKKIFATREIYKRIYTVGKEKNPDFLVVANMKKSRLMAIHSFIDVALAGETFVSMQHEDYLDLASFDSVIAEDMGTQWGLIPCYLFYTQGADHYDPQGPRSRTLGLFFMHDIWSYIAGACQPYRQKALAVFRDDFDIGASDVVFHPYWDNAAYLTADTVLPEGVEVSFYHRTEANTAIFGVFNTSRVDHQVKIGVNLEKLNLEADMLAITDPFAAGPVDMTAAGVVPLSIPGRRIRYFRIDLKEAVPDGATGQSWDTPLLLHAPFDGAPAPAVARGGNTVSVTALGDDRKAVSMAGNEIYEAGIIGQAILCGEKQSRCEYPTFGNFDITKGTIALWFRNNNWNSMDDKVHMFFNSSAKPGYFRIYKQADTGVFVVQANVRHESGEGWGANTTVFASVPPMPPGEWHHLAVTWDESHMAFYIDGALRARGPDAGAAMAMPAAIGNTFTVGDHVERTKPGNDGGEVRTLIDELMIYGRPLTAEEVRENFSLAEGRQ